MLTKIRFINCQSFKDVTYELATDKLNVIIAENDTGKSIVFKMLKLAGCPKYYDKEYRRELIRHGADHASVGFEFDDGAAAVMNVFPERVIYLYQSPSGVQYQPSLEPPREFVEHLGLLADGDNDFIANIIDADQDLLLVNSNLAYNFALIKLIVFNDDLDNLNEKIDTIVQEYQGYIRNVGSAAGVYEYQLKNLAYRDVNALEQAVDKATMACNSMYSFIGCYDVLERLSSGTAVLRDYDFLLLVCKLLAACERSFSALKSVSVSKPSLQIADVELETKLQEVKDYLEVFTGKVKEPPSEKLITVLENLEEITKRFSSFNISEDRSKLVSVVDVLKKVETIHDSLMLLNQSCQCKTSTTKFITELKEELVSAGSEYDCPIYGKVVYNGEYCVANNF